LLSRRRPGSWKSGAGRWCFPIRAGHRESGTSGQGAGESYRKGRIESCGGSPRQEDIPGSLKVRGETPGKGARKSNVNLPGPCPCRVLLRIYVQGHGKTHGPDAEEGVGRECPEFKTAANRFDEPDKEVKNSTG